MIDSTCDLLLLTGGGEVGLKVPTFFIFCLFGAAPMAYGGSQARGGIGTIAAGLHHSHSNTGSKMRLQPTLQLTATLDP